MRPGGGDRRLAPMRLVVLALVLAAALGHASAARAAPGLVRIVQDDAVLVRGDPDTRGRALDELRDGGADIVRALLHQADATPAAGRATTRWSTPRARVACACC